MDTNVLTVDGIETEIKRLETLRLDIIENKLQTKLNTEVIEAHKEFMLPILSALHKTVEYATNNDQVIITISNSVPTNSIPTNSIPTNSIGQPEAVVTRKKKSTVSRDLFNNNVVKKKPSSRAQLIVTFPDGTVITGPTGRAAFANVINHLNYDDVVKLNIVYSSTPLLTKIKDGRDDLQIKIGDKYIFPFRSNDNRVKYLNKISDELKLKLTVRLAYKM